MKYTDTPIKEYKGFRARPMTGFSDVVNVMFVRADGTEVCCGQAHHFEQSVEHQIRRPLPTWMTGEKEPRLSSYHDAELVGSTCAHGISLNAMCDACIESYGSARAK